jgi:hypothetical protein
MKASALAAGAALVGVLLAGCGGENSGATKLTPGATTPASSAATTATSKATSNGTNGTNGSTTTPSFKGDSNNAFCSFAKDMQSSDVGDLNSDDPATLKANLTKLRNTMQQAVAKAPSDIKADVATLADVFSKYNDLLAKYDYDGQKLSAAAQKDPTILKQATDLITNGNFEQAANRVETYAEQVCGIQDTSTT